MLNASKNGRKRKEDAEALEQSSLEIKSLERALKRQKLRNSAKVLKAITANPHSRRLANQRRHLDKYAEQKKKLSEQLADTAEKLERSKEILKRTENSLEWWKDEYNQLLDATTSRYPTTQGRRVKGRVTVQAVFGGPTPAGVMIHNPDYSLVDAEGIGDGQETDFKVTLGATKARKEGERISCVTEEKEKRQSILPQDFVGRSTQAPRDQRLGDIEEYVGEARTQEELGFSQYGGFGTNHYDDRKETSGSGVVEPHDTHAVIVRKEAWDAARVEDNQDYKEPTGEDNKDIFRHQPLSQKRFEGYFLESLPHGVTGMVGGLLAGMIEEEFVREGQKFYTLKRKAVWHLKMWSLKAKKKVFAEPYHKHPARFFMGVNRGLYMEVKSPKAQGTKKMSARPQKVVNRKGSRKATSRAKSRYKKKKSRKATPTTCLRDTRVGSGDGRR